MMTGPAPGSAPRQADERSFADKARVAWSTHPGGVPDWVLALAEFTDQAGVRLRGAAKQLGYSSAVVSTVIGGTYRGDMARVEEKVRGLLMGLTVDCPELDEISRSVCLDWQKKPRAQTSSLRARMYRACRHSGPGGAPCPHFRHAGPAAEEVPDDE